MLFEKKFKNRIKNMKTSRTGQILQFNTFVCFLSVLLTFRSAGQPASTNEDALFMKRIHDVALTQGQSYNWLRHLTKNIGHRLSGSPGAAAAVEYTRQVLDTLGLDSVWLQPSMVPHWSRGEKEIVRIANSAMGSKDLNALALGNSVGTGREGISAEVIEVKSFDELRKLGQEKVNGKIVFFNRAFDATLLNTFQAYGGAVEQRGQGASEAAKYGAVAVVVRSMSSGLTDTPHTGGIHYQEGVSKIPAVAISTNDAEQLSSLLKSGKVTVYIRTTCSMLSDKLSYNVIGEIRGYERPEEIILVGGHLDSWDVGEGAHDDGTGCVQSMDVLQIIKRLHYRPKRTIRCVLFMNEENGLVGGRVYAEEALKNRQFHLAAIESDRGGFVPRGFTMEADPEVFTKRFSAVSRWTDLMSPYGLQLKRGGGGADISPLKAQKTLLIGYEPDSQRYFYYHHNPEDTFETVNKRELELGTAAMTSLVYLIDKYGLE